MYRDYSLTKQQLGLWIEQRLHPSNTSYNTCVKVKLCGKLDVQRFRNASREVIHFFDTLKVYFVEKKGVPFQRIDDDVEYLPEYIDISDGQKIETRGKSEKAKQILSDKLNTSIDLTQFPIMRASVIKVAEDVYYFIGMVPHIVSDGRAAILYLESLSIAYNFGKQGLEDEYGATKKNWEDFYLAKLHETEPHIYAANKAHWQQRLKEAKHYFDYSYGKQLVDPDDKRGERVYFDLSEELSQQLKAYSKSQRTTLFNILVCAFSIFIHKYYKLTDILIGYPVNIRPPGFKHFFGFFVNILPVRVDMKGDPSCLELLQKIHQVRREDKKHQKYPALDIVSDIRNALPDFDGRVFNLSMAQTVSRLFDLKLDGIKSEPLDSEYYDVNDDFSLSYELIGQRIGLWFEYRKALFDRGFINQAMGHIESIIRQTINYPERKISEIQLLDPAHKQAILQSSQNLNEIDVAPNNLQTLVSLFEEQVTRTPLSIAIFDGDDRFTYQQVNQRANSLAREIIEIVGDKPQAIAISLERGIDLIVSVLAVLKSGNHYVPIPSYYPQKRMIHILSEAKTGLWISNSDESEKIILENNDLSLTTYNMQNNRVHLESQEQSNLGRTIINTELAYIVYTSGSTGKPKGVKLTHHNVVSRLSWLKDYFNFSSADRMLQNTDFSFDVSVAEIFWPLISGASLVIADQKKSRDAKYLLSLIQTQRITCCCMVPSLLRTLLSFDKNALLSSIKQILSAGEPLSTQLKNDFYGHESIAKAVLYNFYGPTEATVYASFEKTSRDQLSSVTIGRPLGNTSLLVLDEKLEPLPYGVVGELYIGGDGVADGYQSNRDLTQEAFIQDPFSTDRYDRLYRTGDLVRYDFNGNLQYIGRTDQQVKIRGFRVELEEIESVISRCENVGDITVIDYKKNETQTQLVAYLVLDEANADRSEDIIGRVKKQISVVLPNYMTPSLFVIVKKIPRLPSDKVDRSRLPNPLDKITHLAPFKKATSEIEIALVNIWSNILSIDANKMSVNASFFDLGGDSLMAIQFVSLAEGEGLYFDMGDLFELRNIEELALAVKKSPCSQLNNEMVSGIYPLLPRQVKFFKDNFINPHHWNRTFSFTLNHDLDISGFSSAIRAVLNHHDNLRVKFVFSEGNGWQQYCEPVEPDIDLSDEIFTIFNLSDLSAIQQNQKMTEVINLAHRQIDLATVPLIRMLHFSTSKGKGQLVIIFHHLLLDMVSSRLIFEDLIRAYESVRNSVSIPFPPKTTSVRNWVLNLEKISKQKDFSKSLSYWSEMPELPTPQLPFDFDGGGLDGSGLDLKAINNEASTQLKAFVLDVEHTNKLLVDLPQKCGMPIQDFLLASLFELMSSWIGLNSMMVSTCGHGREVDSKQFNLSRTVGWLNTVFPVHLFFPENQNIAELNSLAYLKQIQEQLARVPQDNIDYNILRYYVEHPEILQHATPNLFFNYVGQLDSIIPAGAPFIPSLDLPGVAGIDGKNHLCYQLYFEAGVIGGQLTFRLTYSENLFKRETVDSLANSLLDCIESRLNDVCG